MTTDKYNSSHYRDPTAAAAIDDAELACTADKVRAMMASVAKTWGFRIIGRLRLRHRSGREF